MKKLLKITTVGLVLSAFSTLGLAHTPVDDLFSTKAEQNLGAGACGYPPSSNPNFCSCFLTQSVASCKDYDKKHGIPPATCNTTIIGSTYRSVTNADTFCSGYIARLPAGVSVDECATDIQYFQQHHC